MGRSPGPTGSYGAVPGPDLLARLPLGSAANCCRRSWLRRGPFLPRRRRCTGGCAPSPRAGPRAASHFSFDTGSGLGTLRILPTVGVAQLVRASDCGSEGRGFKSPRPPRIPSTRSPRARADAPMVPFQRLTSLSRSWAGAARFRLISRPSSRSATRRRRARGARPAPPSTASGRPCTPSTGPACTRRSSSASAATARSCCTGRSATRPETRRRIRPMRRATAPPRRPSTSSPPRRR